MLAGGGRGCRHGCGLDRWFSVHRRTAATR